MSRGQTSVARGLFKAFLIVGAAFWFIGAQGGGIIFGACLMGWLLDMDSF